MKIEIVDKILQINGQAFVVDKYKIIKSIGCGANAEVFLVHNEALARVEAMKIWRPNARRKTVDPERFRTEIHKNANINNSGVATIYDGNIVGDIYYCTMEYCPGVTLRKYLCSEPVLIKRYTVLQRICNILKEVYAKGIYHGDLHADNIIIGNDDIVKILDFGTSIFAKSQDASHERDAKMLYDLALSVLPELSGFSFVINENIRKLASPLLCEVLLAALRFIEDKTPKYSNERAYKEAALSFYVMVTELPVFELEQIEAYMRNERFPASASHMFWATLHSEFVARDNTMRSVPLTSNQYNELIGAYNKTREEFLSEQREILAGR